MQLNEVDPQLRTNASHSLGISSGRGTGGAAKAPHFGAAEIENVYHKNKPDVATESGALSPSDHGCSGLAYCCALSRLSGEFGARHPHLHSMLPARVSEREEYAGVDGRLTAKCHTRVRPEEVQGKVCGHSRAHLSSFVFI